MMVPTAKHEGHGLDDDVVAVDDGIHHELAEAGDREHRLDDDGRADQEADRDAQEVDGGDERIAEHMGEEDVALAEAPWSAPRST